ncbi:MAG: CocE/NonD family hydrolase, partial [Armatimonadetes bacterium]|nr:CocE/NonD family hydrolase [Armatimonadota bacterium]
MSPAVSETQPRITGRVIDAVTGRAPARLPIAAVRVATLEAAPPEAPAPVEWRGASYADGLFVVELAGASGDEEVVVFTASPLYTCATAGASLPVGWPTSGALLAASPQALRPSAEHLVELVVQPVVAVEPRTEMVPMTDGARLATEVFLPAAEGGPWPAVLARTPYGRFWLHDLAAVFLARGYAFVAQDMRGRFDSEGEAIAFADCGWAGHRDGYTTVEWVASQSWCDGRVATVGGSALGITQYLLAPTAPPHLVCQVVAVGAPSLYHHVVYRGGLFAKADIEEWLRANAWPDENLALMRAHYTYDSWWRDFDAATQDKVAAVKVPALHIGGWFDIFQQGTIDAFLSWQHGGGEGARGRQRLIMGPWTHAIGGTSAGQLSWPDNAALDVAADAVAFVESCMRGQPEQEPPQPPVRYYLMGSTAEPDAPGNIWR